MTFFKTVVAVIVAQLLMAVIGAMFFAVMMAMAASTALGS